MSGQGDEQRLSKMRAVWRETAPDARAVNAAYRRFEGRARATSRHWTFELLLGAGAAALGLLAVGGLHVWGEEPRAASGTVLGRDVPAPSVSSPIAAQSEPGESAPGKGLWLERQGRVEALAPGYQYSVDAGKVVAVVIDGQRQLIEGPRLFELSLEVDRASGFRLYVTEPRGEEQRTPPEGPRRNEGIQGSQEQNAARRGEAQRDGVDERDGVERGATRQSASSSSASARSPAAPGAALPSRGSMPAVSESDEHPSAWSRAAEAMRDGDSRRAAQELESLSRSAAGQTRDAAQLTLAQLWLSEGAVERARPVLQRLSQEGATAHIRRRASELLASP